MNRLDTLPSFLYNTVDGATISTQKDFGISRKLSSCLVSEEAQEDTSGQISRAVKKSNCGEGADFRSSDIGFRDNARPSTSFCILSSTNLCQPNSLSFKRLYFEDIKARVSLFNEDAFIMDTELFRIDCGECKFGDNTEIY